ncbi:hypothetical protein F2Q68_00043462 [Brassica cretica]|uniref:Uncharacterized protein n=1 Tax=Brassica cretica TaxID=69181 RepID=A0A8S9LPW8_BRACR|nr:hypothetical protein F2Q68_00043462 [Brassica cretica]
MGTLKKSPRSELSTEEVARGRLLLLSCATQVWKSELPSFLSRSTPSFVESKGVYVYLRVGVVDNNLNSVFARVRSITNQYKASASLHGNHKDVSLADVPVEQLRKLMPLLLSSQRANIGIAVAPTTDAVRGASDIHLTKP